MENLHIIATDKSLIKGDLLLRHLWKGTPDECISWWRYNDTRNYGDTVVYTTLNGSFMDSPSSFKVQHIYITSDEELNKDTKPCWCLDTKNNSVNYYQGALPLHNYIGYKKIILSTDQDLINDGVQSIDDEFLEWFVKNPSCEEVEVFQEKHHFGEVVDESYPKGFFDYKIIIPKEEQKELRRKLFTLIKSLEQEEPKKETLEEAIERFLNGEYLIPISSKDKVITKQMLIDGANNYFSWGFLEAVKWQQEQDKNKYSEDEVRQIAEWSFHFHKTNDFSDSELADEWELRLEKMFKKK